jgi:hypothetical protein
MQRALNVDNLIPLKMFRIISNKTMTLDSPLDKCGHLWVMRSIISNLLLLRFLSFSLVFPVKVTIKQSYQFIFLNQ